MAHLERSLLLGIQASLRLRRMVSLSLFEFVFIFTRVMHMHTCAKFISHNKIDKPIAKEKFAKYFLRQHIPTSITKNPTSKGKNLIASSSYTSISSLLGFHWVEISLPSLVIFVSVHFSKYKQKESITKKRLSKKIHEITPNKSMQLQLQIWIKNNYTTKGREHPRFFWNLVPWTPKFCYI